MYRRLYNSKGDLLLIQLYRFSFDVLSFLGFSYELYNFCLSSDIESIPPFDKSYRIELIYLLAEICFEKPATTYLKFPFFSIHLSFTLTSERLNSSASVFMIHYYLIGLVLKL